MYHQPATTSVLPSTAIVRERKPVSLGATTGVVFAVAPNGTVPMKIGPAPRLAPSVAVTRIESPEFAASVSVKLPSLDEPSVVVADAPPDAPSRTSTASDGCPVTAPGFA